ncbi:mitogen-activated protein kinase kinase kinase [Thraustotheca clavata]|uniref:Mitogen-activated protein kinase kinase kinase n=1 Tax=Thraustotheca clavata TaxID=74557 RepID=A0A1V9YXM2_9STRA|nr:mitogen-activated protein kinase kinase kinase [Thraustotheca clavata]
MGGGTSKTSTNARSHAEPRPTSHLLSVNVAENRTSTPPRSPKSSLYRKQLSDGVMKRVQSTTSNVSKEKEDDGANEYANDDFEAEPGLHSTTGINLKYPSIFPWKKGEMLGTGSFGAVYLARNEYTGDLMAVKEISYSEEAGDEVVAIQQEVFVLRSLDHPNIVKYLGSEYNEQSKTLYIFTEWVPGGSLEDSTKTFGCSEPVAQKYAYQILLGMEYLHSRNVVHYDIKPSNILIDQFGGAKLADFGASRLLGSSSVSKNKSIRGTPYYMAPEVIKQTGISTKADIWSLGCTVLKILTGIPLWKTMKFQTEIALFFHIANLTEPPTLPDSISHVAKSFILACLQINPTERLSADGLLKHPFIHHRHFQATTTGPQIQDHFKGRATTAGVPVRIDHESPSPPRTAIPLFHPSNKSPPRTTTRTKENMPRDTKSASDGTLGECVLPSLTPPKKLDNYEKDINKHAKSTSGIPSQTNGDAQRRHSHEIRGCNDNGTFTMPQIPSPPRGSLSSRSISNSNDNHATSPSKQYDDTPILTDLAKRERDLTMEREAQKQRLKVQKEQQWREEQEAYKRSLT